MTGAVQSQLTQRLQGDRAVGRGDPTGRNLDILRGKDVNIAARRRGVGDVEALAREDDGPGLVAARVAFVVPLN